MKISWKIFIFLIVINLLVSAGATLAVLYYWENIRNTEKPYELITVTQPTQTIPVPTYPVDYEIVSTPTILPTVEEATNSSSAPVRDRLVKITQVLGVGDGNAEAVYLESNADQVVQLENWSIEDAEGNTFVFPNIQLMRKGVFIPLFTRSGHSTPFELYWGKADPVWQSGETVILKDSDGNVQSTYRIP